jgi:hypothetical protein
MKSKAYISLLPLMGLLALAASPAARAQTTIMDQIGAAYRITGAPVGVPEPGTSAIMLGGLGVLAGAQCYRRRTV